MIRFFFFLLNSAMDMLYVEYCSGGRSRGCDGENRNIENNIDGCLNNSINKVINSTCC